MQTLVSQRNDHLYLTAPVEVITPSTDEIASFQNAKLITDGAPNDNILWLRGHYIEADVPNRNGQMWTSEEVAIKALTPKLMPITVMHGPTEVVGVIADVALRTPDKDGADRASIDTVLAVWKHRFPEIAEEIMLNHEQGMLMQSMECDAPAYTCSECSNLYVKPVDERSWCDHLQNGTGVRTLRDVTFTGTGLIFGSRGKQGADPNASLAVLDEVAEWSDSRVNRAATKKGSRMTVIEIERSEYDTLKAAAARVEAAEKSASDAVAALETSQAENKDLGDKLTLAEKSTEDAKAEAADLQTKVDEFTESAAQEELASKRISEVSADLAKALPDGARQRLVTKAKSMTDDEWTDEIASLSELLKVKNEGDPAGMVFAEEAMSGFRPQGRQPETQPSSGADIAASVGSMLRNHRKPSK